MKIDGVIWYEHILDKIAYKHHVEAYEVEEVLNSRPKVYFAEKGERKDEDVYLALGQTEAGRYLAVFFIYKKTQEALILSSRDMERKERDRYDKK